VKHDNSFFLQLPLYVWRLCILLTGDEYEKRINFKITCVTPDGKEISRKPNWPRWLASQEILLVRLRPVSLIQMSN